MIETEESIKFLMLWKRKLCNVSNIQ